MDSRRRAAKFENSVVMRFLFVGWFSATAGGKSTLCRLFSKQGFLTYPLLTGRRMAKVNGNYAKNIMV
jgi:hypothetical protein